MKGMQYNAALMIIVVVAVLFVIALVIGVPLINFANAMDADITFSEFCYYWGYGNYAEGYGEPVERGGRIYGCPAGCTEYPNHCPSSDIQECKRLCEGV